MVTTALNHQVSRGPLNIGQQIKRSVTPDRLEDEAITVTALADLPSDGVVDRLSNDDRALIDRARRAIDSVPAEAILTETFESGADPIETAGIINSEAEKREEFYSDGSNLYLDQALAIDDPSITSEISRMATNIQIGQELFRQAIEESKEDTSWFGYGWDFFDRNFLRTIPIGGFEQVTNRNERKGRELVGAAVSMSSEEYTQYIKSYIEELKSEGFFTGDNIFAILDGMAEFENSGYDSAEFFNRVFGAVDLAPLAVLKLRLLTRAASPLRRVAVLKGPERAADVGEAAIRSNTASPRTYRDMAPSAIDPGTPAPIHVPSNRATRIATENSIIREVSETIRSGALGRALDSDEVQAAYHGIVNTMRKVANNPLVDVRPPVHSDATGNFIATLTLGTVKTGSPYRTQRAAAKVAARVSEEFPTARAVAVDSEDISKGFYVEVDEILDVGEEIAEIGSTPMYGAIRSALGRFFGSKAVVENEFLNTLATMAEGVASTLTSGRAVKDAVKALNRIPSSNQRVISSVLSELRDGKDAFLREHYTDAEFVQKFREHHPRGLSPTDDDIAAFDAARTLNDASYMLRAHNRMQKYISNNFYALVMSNGERVPGRITDEALGAEPILDVSTGVTFIKRDLRANTRVWELDREIDSGIRYVVNPQDVKSISHSDVLGYNAGGRRINPKANHFVLLDGDFPRAFLATFTEKEALRAQEQIKNIQEALKESGDAASNTRILDKVVRENNEWNTELQSIEDFIKFGEEKGLDWTRSIEVKARDGEIRPGETRDFYSTTWDEYISHDLHRADDTLIEFGGKEARNYDPVQAMFLDFGSISQQFAHNIYTQTALNAWLKTARRSGSGWDVPDTTDVRLAFREAASNGELTSTALELGRQRGIIETRLGMRSEIFKAMEQYGADVQEWVFDTTKGTIALPRDPAKGVAQKVLNLGFQSAFGLLNVSQFFVQGFHAVTIAAMTQKGLLSAGSGLKALAMAPATRAILMGSLDEASEKLMVSRLSRWAGQSEDEMAETIEFIRTQGRDILDGSMVELGTGAQWGLSGWKGESFLPSAVKDAQRTLGALGGGVLKAGLTPFREGERLSRLTGINAAIIEYRLANPGKSLNTAEARKWISRREQALSFRMTNANRAFMQEGFGKLPTQWFTYTLRSMENIFIGRDLTVGERTRMAMALFPSFGLTGMGAASATDWLAEKIGAEPAGAMHGFIQYGILDTLLSEMTDGEVELALADRLAPITLLQDIYQGVNGTKSAWEMLIGPSGNILSDVMGQVVNVGGEIVNGNSVSITEDLVRTARQFSGVDNVYKAYGIYQNGVYRSRTGKTLPFEMDASDAVGQLLGFSPREVSEWYQERQWSYNHSRVVRGLTTELENDVSRAMEIWDNGDRERAITLLQEVQHKIVLSGLSPYDQRRIRRSLTRQTGNAVYQMIMEHQRRGNTYRADVIERTFGGN